MRSSVSPFSASELAEVLGQVATQPVLELRDLLRGITVAGELGDGGVVEEAESLQRL